MTWANCSRSLICLERPERFAHGRSFPLSDLSDSLTVAHFSWAIWANRSQSLIWFEQNEQMSKWANERWATSQPLPADTVLAICNNALETHFGVQSRAGPTRQSDTIVVMKKKNNTWVPFFWIFGSKESPAPSCVSQWGVWLLAVYYTVQRRVQLRTVLASKEFACIFLLTPCCVIQRGIHCFLRISSWSEINCKNQFSLLIRGFDS